MSNVPGISFTQGYPAYPAGYGPTMPTYSMPQTYRPQTIQIPQPDQFVSQQQRANAIVPVSSVLPNPISKTDLATFAVRYPTLANLTRQAHNANMNPAEPPAVQTQMIYDVAKNISHRGRQNLMSLISNGKLFDTNAEDNRSTLAHLYDIMTVPRATGLQGKTVLEETIKLLANPVGISQRFAPLLPQYEQALIQYYNSGRGPKLAKAVGPEDIFPHSATCVAASVMHTMFSRQPSEAVRHIAELTSPRRYFTERATINDISPDNPQQAAQKLAQYGIKNATPVSPNTYQVNVKMSDQNLLRTLSQQSNKQPDTQSVIESAYQLALMELADPSFDAGLATLVKPDGTLDQDPGIVADRKTLMESIVKDTGPVSQIDYQVTAADKSNEPYLMGYLRQFEKTAEDLVKSVNSGNNVIIGIVETDNNSQNKGRLSMKHEVTVVDYHYLNNQPSLNNLVFKIVDSDDSNDKAVYRRALELLPQIHHAGLPQSVGQKVAAEINQLQGRYMTPGPEEAQKFKLIDTVPTTIQPQFMADFQNRQMAEMRQQQGLSPILPQQQAQPQQQQGYPFAYPIQNPYTGYPGNYYPQSV